MHSKNVSRLYLQSMQIKMNTSRWQLIPVSGKVSVSPHCKESLKVGFNVGVFCVGITF